MLWTTVTFCAIGLWAMLMAFGGERRRQLNEQAAIDAVQADQKAPPPSAGQ